MAEFFGKVIQFLENIWAFIFRVWDFFEYVWAHFGISLILDFALKIMARLANVGASFAAKFGRVEINQLMVESASLLSGNKPVHLFAIAGHIADFFVPVIYLEVVIGLMVFAWFVSLNVRLAIRIKGLIWASG